MRSFRSVLAVATSVLLVGLAFTSGPAAAQTAGVGTALTSTKALVAQIGTNGSILDVGLLADEARSTTDQAVATPESFSRVTALSTKTSIAPASALNQTIGAFEARNTGPTTVNLALPAEVSGALATLAPVVSADLGGKLTAVLDGGVANAGMDASLSNLKTVGGLLSLGSIKSANGALAAGDAATASRTVSVDDVTVLKLGALLTGLGIPLDTLSVNQVIALIDGLAASTGLGLPSGSTTLAGAISSLQGAINDLQGAVAGAATVAQVTGAIDSTTTTLLGLLGIPSSPISASVTVGDATTAVNNIIDQLQAQIQKLVSDGLKALADVALLRFQGVEVGVSTKAASTVDGSVAAVTAKIGKISVGGVELGGLDLASSLDSVNATVAAVSKKVSDTLAIVSPDLANLVKISVFDKVQTVAESGGYVRSRAGLTAASVTVTPPATLSAIVSGLAAQTGTVKSTLSSVPVLPAAVLMDQLTSALGLGTSALASPVSLQVAPVLSASDFALVSGGTTGGGAGGPGGGGELPRTGGTPGGGALVLLAGLAAGLALVIRRWSLPAVRMARIDD